MTEERQLDWLSYHNYKPAYRYVVDPVKEAAVDDLLSKVTPRQREVLELHAVGRLSFAAIGRMLGITDQTVGKLYRRAIKNAAQPMVPIKPGSLAMPPERVRQPTIQQSQATSAHGNNRGYRYVGEERKNLINSACCLQRDGVSGRNIAVILRVSKTLVDELLREGRRLPISNT